MQIILAITAKVDAKDQAPYVAAGMNDFIAKPVPHELLATMQKRLQCIKSG